MIDARFLFVLGAGASKEVNLPVGAELRAQIARVLDIRFEHFSTQVSGERIIADAFRLRARALDPVNHDINQYLNSSWKIRDAMPQAASIDNYLDAHATDQRLIYCGKVAIAHTILEAERQSSLYFDERSGASHPDFQAIEATWYNQLWQKLAENCRLDDLPSRLENIVVIDFNYDRCLEHFLHCAIQNYYGLDGNSAAEMLRPFKIFHPYGKVGNLPWSAAGEPVSFGKNATSKTLNQIAEEIRTFTEGTDPDSSDILQIKDFVDTASTIVFLGFAYHRLNLKLLFPKLLEKRLNKKVNVYGTAKGISHSDCEMITSELSDGLDVSESLIRIRPDLTSSGLFREFGRSISFA